MPISRVSSLLVLGLLMGACAPAAGPGASSPAGAADPSWQLPALPPPAAIAADEYAARRTALAGRMQDGVLLALGTPETEYDYLPFSQASGFRYLTGIMEPGAALVIEKRGGTVREHLFVLPRSPDREVWEGARLGPDGARSLTGIESREIDELPGVLDALLGATPRLYTLAAPAASGALLQTLSVEQQVVERLRARHAGLTVIPFAAQVQALRASKSPRELDLIRRAVHVSALAHRAAMRSVQPGMNEFEMHALVEYVFRRNGVERPAYSSIVGSGPNATTLHYRSADRYIEDGELLLIDAGASYRGYAADITRTMPANGRFSPEQREIYDIVLRALKSAESLVRPGGTWNELSAAADSQIAQGLAELGLIESATATYRCDSPQIGQECPQYRLFFMHGLGHGIGLDVHDPEISYTNGFQNGSVFTIEPGIYIRADALDFLPDVPANRAMIERLRPVVERYRNIGVRIEDNYIVTEAGVERVSAGVPREADEVEALMRQPGLDPERRGEIVEWYRATTPR
jgi:Xaa-Pro aminopeptidase